MKSVLYQPEDSLISEVIKALEAQAKEANVDLNIAALDSEGSIRDCDLFLCSLDYGAQKLAEFTVHSVQSKLIGSFDSLHKLHKVNLPEVAFTEAFSQCLLAEESNLDIRRAAYVVADNYQGAAVAAACSSVGFQEIYIVTHSSEKIQELVALLKRNFFGVKFHILVADSLTVDNVPGSLLVNCVDLVSDSALGNDLAYFNFLSGNSLVIDLAQGEAESHLLSEAREAGLNVQGREKLIQELAKVHLKFLISMDTSEAL